MISSLDARIAFNNAYRKLPILAKRMGVEVNMKSAILSQSYLRFEVTIDPNRTSYQFPVLITQQSQTGASLQAPSERRLQLQDTFFVSHMQYGLQLFSGYDNPGSYTGLRPWLNTFNSTILRNWVDLDRIVNFWNGDLSLKVNQRVVCPQWDLRRHYDAPQTQRPLWQPAATPWAYSDQNEGGQTGYYPVEPNWLLAGSTNCDLTMNLNEPLGLIANGGAIGASETVIKAVVVVRGILAQNSTVVR